MEHSKTLKGDCGPKEGQGKGTPRADTQASPQALPLPLVSSVDKGELEGSPARTHVGYGPTLSVNQTAISNSV